MDWNSWRDEFPILSRRTYLNSCSLGALSRRAEARIATFHEEWHDMGASAWYEIWWGRLDELRGRVARMLNAESDEVALAASTSVALAAVASSLDYAARPRVVTAALDFPTLSYQWLARPGVQVIQVPSSDGATVDPQRFADAVDERTAVLATSHVFYTTGAIQDLRALADIAHARGALFLVDAYQGAGQVPIDVKAAGVDVLVTGPLKWLMGGPGLSYLYVSRELAHLRPTIAGWFGARDPFAFAGDRLELREDARRFEMGTPALPTVHAALGGQEIVDGIGVEAIRARNGQLTEHLRQRLLEGGWKLTEAPVAENRSAIVMVAHPEEKACVARLGEQGIIVDSRPGHVRISPHFYNTVDELERVVDAMGRAR